MLHCLLIYWARACHLDLKPRASHLVNAVCALCAGLAPAVALGAIFHCPGSQGCAPVAARHCPAAGEARGQAGGGGTATSSTHACACSSNVCVYPVDTRSASMLMYEYRPWSLLSEPCVHQAGPHTSPCCCRAVVVLALLQAVRCGARRTSWHGFPVFMNLHLEALNPPCCQGCVLLPCNAVVLVLVLCVFRCGARGTSGAASCCVPTTCATTRTGRCCSCQRPS